MTTRSEVIVYLKALGIAEDMDSFVGRKRIQKIVYLLKQFGADMQFGYTWYLHGPYSPQLTRTLFNSDIVNETERELNKNQLDIVIQARNFLGTALYDINELELVVSLIYLIKHGKDEDLINRSKIIEFLLSRKPQYTIRNCEEALEKIESTGKWKILN